MDGMLGGSGAAEVPQSLLVVLTYVSFNKYTWNLGGIKDKASQIVTVRDCVGEMYAY